MTTLTAFKSLRLLVINVVFGILLATGVASLVARAWPAARVPVFLGVWFFYISGGLAVVLRALHRGKSTAVIRIFEFMPLVLIGVGLIFLLGGSIDFFSGDGVFFEVMAITVWLVVCASIIREIILDHRAPKERPRWLQP